MDRGPDRPLARAVKRRPAGPPHDQRRGARRDDRRTRMPAAMLFLRKPGGISHHPDETSVTRQTSRPRSRSARAFLERRWSDSMADLVIRGGTVVTAAHVSRYRTIR